MSRKALSDAGVGRAVFATRVHLFWHAVMMAFFLGAVPGFVVWHWAWLRATSPLDRSVVRVYGLAALWPRDWEQRWVLRSNEGGSRVITVTTRDGRHYEWLTPEQAKVSLSAYAGALDAYRRYLRLSLFTGAGGFALIWAGLTWLGGISQENTRLRGAQPVVSAAALSQLARRRGGSAYRFATVALPKSALTTGIIATGAPGSGKSMAINDLLVQVFTRGRKCIIYDQSSEYFRAHFRPGKDHFFNPSMVGSVPWSIFAELQFTYDADTLARAFLPPASGSGNSEFFRDAARALFSVLLLRLTEKGAVNTQDLAKAFLEMPAEEMDHLIRNSVASSSVAGDSKQQRQGVLSSIAIYLNGIAAVGKGAWTIRGFLEEPGDARLFILSTDDTKAMFAPLFRLMITAAFGEIAARQEIVHGDRYWFFLDEVHTLGDIRLDEQMATMRKFGAAIVTGIQSEKQFFAGMGPERAETVLNCLQTALLLQSNETTQQERIAKRLGRMEVNTVNRNQALAIKESRDGAGLNALETERWAVRPEDIAQLDSCTGFVQLPGNLPAARVDYRHWHRAAWAIFPARRDRWAPRQELPPRDPGFTITRDADEQEFDAIRASVMSELRAPGESAPGAAPGSASTSARDTPSADAGPAQSAAPLPNHGRTTADRAQATGPSPTPGPPTATPVSSALDPADQVATALVVPFAAASSSGPASAKAIEPADGDRLLIP